MASSTTTPTFSFHLKTSLCPPKPKSHIAVPPLHRKVSHKPLRLFRNPYDNRLSPPQSIDVSKEDKPISDQPELENPTAPEAQKFDKRRLEEKFAVLNTGIYECRSCGYRYDEAVGDTSYPVPPGLPFDRLPEDWRCPTCGAAKSFFESKSVEIAGFAQNQQFGLGLDADTVDLKQSNTIIGVRRNLSTHPWNKSVSLA
ncbi:hypothetical protein Nepgr_009638 [Nepenthes gracilis]|uniref:Rubredoxin-like domain-containing protein n=1 Tax=Nepenthes gracilis TaxID=150966 RepID=A0AAD3XKB8_NEPGR|nr:hypothetical protein Nepgr_009638 [Nepenthes gracilis]